MITQGFPLYAVESDGRVFAVVGWDEYQYPFLLLLDAPGAAARNPLEHERFTFTTTDPRIGADANKIAYELADLRQRMAALADVLESHGYHDSARSIRQELNK